VPDSHIYNTTLSLSSVDPSVSILSVGQLQVEGMTLSYQCGNDVILP